MTTIDKEKVSRAMALIKKGSANADYFFEQLESPAWIQPLARENLFSKPYSAIRRGESYSFPVWVPGEYLARMAPLPEAQAEILQILKDLPESDNPRVYEAVATAAAALPPEMAKELVPQLLRGIELRFQLLLPALVSSVIARLADGGLATYALELTRALLAIESSPGPTEADGEELRWIHREAKSRIDAWHYGEVLDQISKSLVQSAPFDAFPLLCDLLEQAVAAGRLEPEVGDDDYSYVWRPSIKHSPPRRENIRDELVSAVRDAGRQIAELSSQNLREIVEHLRGRPTKIFHRIALFLVAHHGEDDIAVVQQLLSDPEDWDDTGLHPEYELLLAQFFGRLSIAVQKTFLDWIDEGPDSASYIEFRKQMDGQEPAEADVRLHRDVWIRDHLNVLAPHLSAEGRERLAGLERIGPAREVGRPVHRVWVGSRGEHSPLTEAETLSLGWPLLIAKLRDWSPPADAGFDGPSKEGLADSVRQRVAAYPRAALQDLDQIVDIEPRYISAILEALRKVINEKAVLEWKPLLAFLQRTVDQADTAADHVDEWRWVSKCAASLIDDSFEAGPASIPISFRAVVWGILARLAENPDPTSEHEDRYGGSNMDPATLSLNTVRGETFHAVVRYSLWVRRDLESKPDAAQRLLRGFDEFPEVRTLLDRHLDPELEPSLAVRAVYGQWFPWLVLLDQAWATDRVGAVFPEDSEQAPRFWAAWGTYIVFCNPYTNVLPVLRPVYRRAINAIRSGMAPTVGMGERPSEHLADHLMTYYWRGELTLSDDLVTSFFNASEPKLRGHALETLGRTLTQLDDAPSREVDGRLTALWTWRMSQAPIGPEELQAFGWWFGSARLDQAWSLRTLGQLLSSAVLPEPDHLVVERLAAIAEAYPLEAVTSLENMIDLTSEGWAIHGWLESARTILEVGLRSGDRTARERAERVINKLGALRFREFSSLLPARDTFPSKS